MRRFNKEGKALDSIGVVVEIDDFIAYNAKGSTGFDGMDTAQIIGFTKSGMPKVFTSYDLVIAKSGKPYTVVGSFVKIPKPIEEE